MATKVPKHVGGKLKSELNKNLNIVHLFNFTKVQTLYANLSLC